ncbi:hypothetical protein [Streptomyces sp. AA1529]|uniref:hypothetical protein n=1 Tax=Streptomyces sp. AA1529 TaxID=1203257 RepID=UPI0003801DC4|nr:hypothetical protein [Streptomyces sp. AA1529]
MFTESVLLESRSARSGMTHRVDVLDEVQALAISTGAQATTQDVADYFEVPPEAVEELVGRHRDELVSNGMSVLRSVELREYQTDKVSVPSEQAQGRPQRRSGLTVFSRSAVLNVAMLLRDSVIAQRVRTHLLYAEESARVHPGVEEVRQTTRELRQTVRTLAAGYGSLDRRVGHLATTGVELGALLRELVPDIGRVSARAERMDHRSADTEQRTERTEQMVCAMRQRLAGMGEEMRGVRRELQAVVRAVGAESTLPAPRTES